MSWAYKYSKGSLSKGKALLSRLRRELDQNLQSILTGLRSDESDIGLSFSRELTTAEQSALEQVIAQHDGDEKPADLRWGKTLQTMAPGAYEGEIRFIVNGRKRGEAANRGTGVVAYWSAGRWRRFRDDRPVVK